MLNCSRERTQKEEEEKSPAAADGEKKDHPDWDFGHLSLSLSLSSLHFGSLPLSGDRMENEGKKSSFRQFILPEGEIALSLFLYSPVNLLNNAK